MPKRRCIAKANVIDYVANRVEFVATGLVELPQPVAKSDILKALHAARLLKEQLTRQVWAAISRFQDPGPERKLPMPLVTLRSAVRRRDGAEVRISKGTSYPNNIVGDLAETWQWSDDGTRLTFKLIENATFGSGLAP